MIEESEQSESQQDEEDEESSSQVKEATTSKKIKSGIKETRDIDRLFSGTNIAVEKIAESTKRFIFKIIYETLNRRNLPQMTLEELWSLTSKNTDSSSVHGITSKSDLLDVILSIESDGKILFSDKDKDITLI
jgi:hypothetical protein